MGAKKSKFETPYTRVGLGISHPQYCAWNKMMARCYNPRDPQYRHYGGRGIRVAEEFFNMQTYVDYLGPKPGPEYSVDRIDVDGHYEPGNVRWATKETQSINQRLITLRNKSGMCGVSWKKEIGKWACNISIKRVLKHLGYYSDLIEAAYVYNQAALEYHGPDVKQNPIPEEWLRQYLRDKGISDAL